MVKMSNKKCIDIYCGKDVQIYLFTLKNDLFGCFIIEEIHDKTNETGLKEGRGVEMSIYSAFHIRDASLSLSLLNYLPLFIFRCSFSFRFFGDVLVTGTSHTEHVIAPSQSTSKSRANVAV